MSVIFTCGHEATDVEEGYTISIKTYSRENSKAVDYRTVCGNCYHVYELEDMILYGEKDMMEWLETP